MDQMAVLHHGQRIKSYFSALSKDLAHEVKIDWIELKSKDKMLEWLGHNKIKYAAIVIEYFGEQLDSHLQGVRSPVLLAANFQEIGDQEWNLREICSKGKKLNGFIDTSRDIQFYYPLIRSSLQQGRTLMEMINLSETGMKMTHVMSMALGELSRVKKLHERLVPLRNEIFKGLKVYSKFAAGEGSGGEFFDLFASDQHVNFILSSATSYVASSVILSHFEDLRKIEHINRKAQESFLEDLTNELREMQLIDRDRPEMLELAVGQIDLRSMQISGFFFGRNVITSAQEQILNENSYPLNENFYEKSYFETKLHRGERYILFSPGIKKNTEAKIANLSYKEFLKGNSKETTKNLINEIFFQLKKSDRREFLKYDATIICFEVDPNVIVQV